MKHSFYRTNNKNDVPKVCSNFAVQSLNARFINPLITYRICVDIISPSDHMIHHHPDGLGSAGRCRKCRRREMSLPEVLNCFLIVFVVHFVVHSEHVLRFKDFWSASDYGTCEGDVVWRVWAGDEDCRDRGVEMCESVKLSLVCRDRNRAVIHNKWDVWFIPITQL